MPEIRRVRANYAATGAGEIDKSCPLTEGERVLGGGRLRVRRGWRSPLGYYRVTNERVCLVTHRALGPDELTEIPRSMIERVDPPDGRYRIALRCVDGSAIELSPFSWGDVAAAAAAGAGMILGSGSNRGAAAVALYEALTAE